MNFTNFSQAVDNRFNELSDKQLYKMDISKSDIWNFYLDAFPAGANEIFKERREYDCQCCAQFVKNIGNVVAIVNGQIETVWNMYLPASADAHFQVVADKLNDYVKAATIRNIFLHTEPKFGSKITTQILENNTTVDWNHFYCTLPTQYVKRNDCNALLGKAHTNYKLFKRGLDEITIDSCDIVLDLMHQNSLYKGDEFKDSVQGFHTLLKDFTNIKERNIFVWSNLNNPFALIRNTVIGTLLQDLSEGMDINTAVGKFESKVAPTNYKRSSAPITKNMVGKAMNKIKELGLESALERRFASIEDISVNNVIFADRKASKVMLDTTDVLTDLLMKQTKSDTKNYDSVDEISVEDFINNVVPNISTMELLVEGRHTPSFVSIATAVDASAAPLFKWNNPFSWSYTGNITDSIKERVKRAGGNTEGILRCSLSWYNTDDLDINVTEPNRNKIYYGNKRSGTSGTLDVDMNVRGTEAVTDAVENVVWTDEGSMPSGKYEVRVHNYTKRNTSDVGFEIEIEFNNTPQIFTYDKAVMSKRNIHVCDVVYEDGTFEIQNINKDVQTTGKSREVWGIQTEQFVSVDTMMLSPNFWDEQEVGNKHYMFMLHGCVNPDDTRGIYNEFLRGDLTEHRKVLEILADKTKCVQTDKQLSGLGFSSTKRASVVCRVSGNFTRTLKLNF